MKQSHLLLLSGALGLVIAYLSAQAVTGRQGLAAHMALREQERQLLAERDELNEMRDALEARAARLRAGALDLDYLDERARVVLGAGRADEEVFEFNAS